MFDIGRKILGDRRFYFANYDDKSFLDEVYPEFLVGVENQMTIDQAVDVIDNNIAAADFDTGADLCIDVYGEQYFFTGEWEKSF